MCVDGTGFMSIMKKYTDHTKTILDQYLLDMTRRKFPPKPFSNQRYIGYSYNTVRAMLAYYGEASGLCRNGRTTVGGCLPNSDIYQSQGYGRVIIKGEMRTYEGWITTTK